MFIAFHLSVILTERKENFADLTFCFIHFNIYFWLSALSHVTFPFDLITISRQSCDNQSQFNPEFCRLNSSLCVIVTYLWFSSIVWIRVEKEKVQYYSELNDLRTSCDHLSNEKVSSRARLIIFELMRLTAFARCRDAAIRMICGSFSSGFICESFALCVSR